jgi:glycosyltransferase involved in cell wall biosynthesis
MPVYNERATLQEILRRLREVPLAKEIIIVDNCSTDGTREELQQMLERGEAISAHDDCSNETQNVIRIAFQEVNRGKGSSVRRALKLARGEWVIVQDADLEYDPNDFEKLLQTAQNFETKRPGQRVAVFGTRLLKGSAARQNQQRGAFFYGRIGLSVLFRILYATPLSDVATCYKLMRREVAQSLNLQGSGFDLDFEIAARLRRNGVRILEVPVFYEPRSKGEGKKIRAIQDGARAAWTLLRFRFAR